MTTLPLSSLLLLCAALNGCTLRACVNQMTVLIVKDKGQVRSESSRSRVVVSRDCRYVGLAGADISLAACIRCCGCDSRILPLPRRMVAYVDLNQDGWFLKEEDQGERCLLFLPDYTCKQARLSRQITRIPSRNVHVTHSDPGTGSVHAASMTV